MTVQDEIEAFLDELKQHPRGIIDDEFEDCMRKLYRGD